MNREQCIERFYRLVYPSHPNEWEVEEVMGRIADLDAKYQETLFDQVSAIWPVSHSLCLSFLQEGAAHVERVPDRLVPEWVRAILSRYETGGLTQARVIISQVREKFLEPIASKNRVRFEHLAGRMLYYLRGISGESLDFGVSKIPFTDTRSLYLPAALTVFPERGQNELFYKFLISLHWGFIRQGSFKITPGRTEVDLVSEAYGRKYEKVEQQLPILSFLKLFPDKRLAADLFFIIETASVMKWIDKTLPGLARQVSRLHGQIRELIELGEDDITTTVAKYAFTSVFCQSQEDAEFAGIDLTGDNNLEKLIRFYRHIAFLSGRYKRPQLLDLLGRHDFRLAAVEIEKKRQQTKELFIRLLSQLLNEQSEDFFGDQVIEGNAEPGDLAMLILAGMRENEKLNDRALNIDNRQCHLPDEVTELIREIERDMGQVPKSYYAAAAGRAGRGRSAGHNGGGGAKGLEAGQLVYDEWDYRRNGYRKNWCRIFEKEIPVVRSSFVPSTLEKYRGMLVRLRRQFELMRTNERFVGRQREGDDFDLDAIVDVRADQRAGTAVSERIFTNLLRDERDIVTCFLVDMSNSTEGWVGTVIKEALVLLCQAMEVVGDRYGIYGFSGMRRSRCEIFPVKHLNDLYGAGVAERIGSIAPREYTRMGPAVRYAIDMLKKCDERTRLIVALTDGKPEDYDDYKGDYAIEDTRKAWLEARGCGMQTFCITIDRQAHGYLPHMFGVGNYVLVDDIGQLPRRIVDLYRLLTT